MLSFDIRKPRKAPSPRWPPCDDAKPAGFRSHPRGDGGPGDPPGVGRRTAYNGHGWQGCSIGRAGTGGIADIMNEGRSGRDCGGLRDRAPGPGDRPGPLRRGRPGAFAAGPGLVGRPDDGPDHGRPPGQGPALPVHRRPALAPSAESVGRHLREYLDQAGEAVPWFLRLGVALAPVGLAPGRVALAAIARASATHMARRFIAGSTPAEAFETVKALRQARGRLHRRPPGRGRHLRRPRPRPTSRPASS